MAVDSCAIECSRQAADWKQTCLKDCDKRFPAGASVASAAPKEAGSLTGLARFATLDTDRGGHIDKQEFKTFAASRRCNAKTPPSPEEAERMFAALDKDGNGQITLNEVDANDTGHLQKRGGTVDLGKNIDAGYAQKVLAAATAERHDKK
jgi:hypothetical protein